MNQNTKELRTALVFEANNAIQQIGTLQKSLEAISKINFKNMQDAFSDMQKALKQFDTTAKSAGKTVERQQKSHQKEQEKINDLLAKRYALEKEMRESFGKQKGENIIPDLSKEQAQLQALSRDIAEMYMQLGKPSKALNSLNQALSLLNRLDEKAKVIGKADMFADTRKNIVSRVNQIKADEKANNLEQQQKDLEKIQKQKDKILADIKKVEADFYIQSNFDSAIISPKQTQSLYNRLNAIGKRIEKVKGDTTDLNLALKLAKEYLDGTDMTQKNTAYYDSAKAERDRYLQSLRRKENNGKEALSNASPVSAEDIKTLVEYNKRVIEAAIALGDYQEALKETKALAESLKGTDLYQPIFKQGVELQDRHDAFNQEWKDATAREQERKLRAEARKAAKDSTSDEKEKAEVVNLKSLLTELQELSQKISSTRKDGLVYPLDEYTADKKRLDDIKKILEGVGRSNLAKMFDSQTLFQGVKVENMPTKAVDDFNERLKRVRSNAEAAYLQFQKTGDIISRLTFMGAYRELQDMTEEAKRFGKALQSSTDIFSRLANVALLRARWVVGGVFADNALSMPQQLIDTYRELEQAMAGVQQVMPLIEGNQEEVNKETERFIGIAGEYARDINEVAEAGRLWGRGYGKGVSDEQLDTTIQKYNIAPSVNNEAVDTAALEGEKQSLTDVNGQFKDYVKNAEAMRTTNELVRQSAMLATVDNFSMAESVKGLESVLSAYNMRAKSAAEATEFASRAVDIITKVSHTGQISAQDLVQGIEATGKAAEQSGISLSFLSAMIETGVRNTGKSGSEIGQAIKALTVGAHSSKGIKELRKFGIEISKVGADGVRKLRPMQDVILDIATALQKGDKNAENMIMAISGGRYQYSKLASILGDKNEIIRQWGEAINSNGFAKNQLEVQMNTINSKIKEIKANLVELIQKFMEAGSGSGIKTILDTLNTGIKNLSTHTTMLTRGIEGIFAILAVKRIAPFVRSIGSAVNSITEYQSAMAKLGENSSVGSVAKSAGWEIVYRGIDNVTGSKRSLKNATKALDDAEKAENATKKAGQILDAQGNTLTTVTVNGKKSKTAATKLATSAEEAEQVATNAETAAMARQAAVTTVATAGINIAIGVLASLAVGYMTVSNASNDMTEAVNEQLHTTEKEVESHENEVEALKQEISMRQEFIDYADKAVESAQNLQQSIDSGTLSDEKAKKAKEELTTIEANMSRQFGADATQRIKEAGWTSEAYQKEKDNYVNATKTKEQTLQQYTDGLVEYYQTKADLLNQQRLMYEKDLQNFGAWTWGQLEGLKNTSKAWALYYQSLANLQKRWAETMQAWGDDLTPAIKKAYESGHTEIATGLVAVQAAFYTSKKSRMTTFDDLKNKAEAEINEAESENNSNLAETIGKLSSFGHLDVDDSPLFDVTPPEGEYEEPATKTKKGKTPKGSHKKQVWDYEYTGTEAFKMLAENIKTAHPDSDTDMASIMAIAAIVSGNHGTDFRNITDPFKMGAENIWESARLFNQAYDKYDDGTRSQAQILNKIYDKIPENEWQTRLGESADSYRRYNEETYDFNKDKREFKDPNEAPNGKYSIYGYSSDGSTDGSIVGSIDTSQLTNPYIGEMANAVARQVLQDTGEHIDPAYIYGMLMSESGSNVHSNADIGTYGFGGLTTNYNGILDWQLKMAQTLEGGGYDGVTDPQGWIDKEAENNFNPNIHNQPHTIAAVNEYSNEYHSIAGSQSATSNYSVPDEHNFHGFDDRYIDFSNYLHPEAFDKLDEIPEWVRTLFSKIGNDYYYLTGQKLRVNEWNGGDHPSNGSAWGHAAGYKVDTNVDDNQEALKQILPLYGVAAAVESGTHIDWSFGKGGDGRNVDSASRGLTSYNTGEQAYDRYSNGNISGGSKLVQIKDSFWTNSKNPLNDFHITASEKFIYAQQQAEKLYEQTKKQIELEEQLHGKTAATAAMSLRNEENRYNMLLSQESVLSKLNQSFIDDITEYANNHSVFNRKFGSVSDFLYKIPADKRSEYANDSKDKTLQEAVKGFNTVSEQLKTTEQNLGEQAATFNEQAGNMTPVANMEYRLQQLEESHREQTNGFNKNETYVVDQQYYNARLEILAEKLGYYNTQMADVKATENKMIADYNSQIDANENSLKSLNNQLAKGEDVKKQIDEITQKTEKLKRTRDNLENNHSAAYREFEKEAQEVKKQIDEVSNSMDEVSRKLRETIESGVSDMFYGMIKEGQSFKDTWKNLWNNIAKIAIDQLLRVGLFQNVLHMGDWFSGNSIHGGVKRAQAVTIGGMVLGKHQLGRINNASDTGAIRMGIGANTIGGGANYGAKARGNTLSVGGQTLDSSAIGNVTNNLSKMNMSVATTTNQLSANAASLQLNAVAHELDGRSTEQQTTATIEASTALNALGQSAISAGAGLGAARTITLATGGFIPRYATGGTTGEIKGAGTGTSDSILTYLSHRGQFIATSNGEYIVKKSAVDTLGVPFLDMLNNNPELVEPMKAMKRYADGGSLGENYEPVMSAKTIENYKGFNRNKAIIKMDSNKKLEQLMQQQNDMLAGMNTGSSGSVVVLNTQADSASVMKALQKNPRAVQKILGGQKRHGFR